MYYVFGGLFLLCGIILASLTRNISASASKMTNCDEHHSLSAEYAHGEIPNGIFYLLETRLETYIRPMSRNDIHS